MPPAPHNLPSLLSTLSSLADDTRLRLLKLLEQQELGVGELSQVLQLPQPTVSRHLKTLADAGFVTSRREGTSNLYRLSPAELPESARSLWQTAREQLKAWPELEHDQRRLTQLLTEKASDTKSFFAGAAAEWDRLRSELYGDTFTNCALLSLIPPDYRVADLACGTGTAAAALAPHLTGGSVTALDNSPQMLAAAKARCGSLANVRVQEGELTQLPLESGGYDAALLLLALTYLPHPDRAIAEASRILKPGGVLVLVDLMPHARDDFRRKLNQLHPGLSTQELAGWFAAASLKQQSLAPLPSPPNAKAPTLFLAVARRV